MSVPATTTTFAATEALLERYEVAIRLEEALAAEHRERAVALAKLHHSVCYVRPRLVAKYARLLDEMLGSAQ